MNENRSLLKFILLSIITFGIYSLFFIHAYARDMNAVCSGDGKKTGGLLAVIFLSTITFGIYSIVWLYKVGDRIDDNCHARGIKSPCTGGSLLLWNILGSLIFIGPFIGMHKMIKGLNLLCMAYNRGHRGGYGNGPVNVNIYNR